MRNKTLTAVLFATLTVLALAAGACAQELEATTNIPFSFSVNGRVLPAGVYTLRTLGNPNIVTIKAMDSPADPVSMMLNGQADANSSKVKLSFANKGGQHTLVGVQTPAGSIALK